MISLLKWRYVLWIFAISVFIPLQGTQDAPDKANQLPPGREEPLGEMSRKTKEFEFNSESLSWRLDDSSLPSKSYISSRNAEGVVWVDKEKSGLIARLNGKAMGSAYDDVKMVTLSVDGQHLIFTGKHGGNWHVVIDGQEGATPYRSVDSIFLSADGQRSIIIGKRDAKFYFLVNGQEEAAAYEKVGTPMVSENKQHFVFLGTRAGKCYPVVDGKEDENASDIEKIIRLTPEGKLFAWVAKKEKRWQIIVDGEIRAEETGYISDSAISQDGKQIVYFVNRGGIFSDDILVTPDGSTIAGAIGLGRMANFLGNSPHWMAAINSSGAEWHYVVDGVKGPPANALGPFQFTPDGAHWAYAAALKKSTLLTSQEEGFIIFDGQEVIRAKAAAYTDIFMDELMRQSPRFILFDGKLDLIVGIQPMMISSLHGVSDPIINPDGSDVSFSYCVSQKERKVAFRQNKKDSEKFDSVGFLMPAGASGGVLYVAKRPEMLYIIRDETVLHEISVGTDLKFYDFIRSSQGNRNILKTDHGGSGSWGHRLMKIWVDGQPIMGLPCVSIEKLAFTEDEKHWAGLVVNAKADKRSYVVLDGREGKHYDEILLESFSFDSSTGAKFIARDGLRFFRVEQPLDEQRALLERRKR
jgi:hypothetical protein